MSKTRVWIHFSPQLYTDLFKRILQSTETAEVVELSSIDNPNQDEPELGEDKIDLVVLSLDSCSQPGILNLAEKLPRVKFVALSLNGDYGLRRNPGECNWEELRPFGVQQLLQEVTEIGQIS